MFKAAANLTRDLNVPKSVSEGYLLKAKEVGAMGPVTFNKFLLKFDVGEYNFTVFPDGRAIIKGTSDPDKAKTLYAKYVGH